MALFSKGRSGAHGEGAEAAKKAAGVRALDYVESGVKIGLGTGSTAKHFVKALGAAIAKGELKNVVGVPTSRETGRLAEQCGVPLTTLSAAGWLDLTVDGADEVDPNLDLIKGGGGALLIEKIVANASDRMIVIADPAKRVAQIGGFKLPVEITPFGWEVTRAVIERMLESHDVDGREGGLRMKRDEPFITEEGNMLLDLDLKRIGDPATLSAALNDLPGVVDNGLFIAMADVVVIGQEDGDAEILTRA